VHCGQPGGIAITKTGSGPHRNVPRFGSRKAPCAVYGLPHYPWNKAEMCPGINRCISYSLLARITGFATQKSIEEFSPPGGP